MKSYMGKLTGQFLLQRKCSMTFVLVVTMVVSVLSTHQVDMDSISTISKAPLWGRGPAVPLTVRDRSTQPRAEAMVPGADFRPLGASGSGAGSGWGRDSC